MIRCHNEPIERQKEKIFVPVFCDYSEYIVQFPHVLNFLKTFLCFDNYLENLFGTAQFK